MINDNNSCNNSCQALHGAHEKDECSVCRAKWRWNKMWFKIWKDWKGLELCSATLSDLKHPYREKNSQNDQGTKVVFPNLEMVFLGGWFYYIISKSKNLVLPLHKTNCRPAILNNLAVWWQLKWYIFVSDFLKYKCRNIKNQNFHISHSPRYRSQ